SVARCPDSSAPMSSNSFAVAGYVSRSPSAKSAYTRPSSSSSEIASARISRSVKSLKFRAMPTSLLFLDSVSRIGFRETLIMLVPESMERARLHFPAPRSGHSCQPGNSCLHQARHALPPNPHHAVSPSAILRNHRKTLHRFFPACPAPNGIVRAPTPPGSLGTSPATSAILPPANSPPNACKLYIEVHQCPSPRF